MQLPIEVRLKRSRYYLWLLAFLLLASFSAIWFTQPDTTVLLVALLWTFCASLDAYRRHYLLRANSSITAVRLVSDGWSLQTANRNWHKVILLGSSSTVTARFVCLSFKYTEPKRGVPMFFKPTVCLFNDSADAEDLRKLRVALLGSGSEGFKVRGEHRVFGHWR